MLRRTSTGSIMFAAALMLAAVGAKAQDQTKYPDWNGQWLRIRYGSFPNVPFNPAQFDPSTPQGLAQQAPLTPEYQAKFEASLADQRSGGEGLNANTTCLPRGMPRIMNDIFGMEFIITPKTTYILFEDDPPRRIYTDGRQWPDEPTPAFAGYSIGTWIKDAGTGRYGVLEVETRNMKGPRSYDFTGLPLHEDDETVIKERIHLDKADPDVLQDEITTIDHALTRPWTVTKNYRRQRNARWFPNDCTEDNHHVTIGKENYFVSGDGYLMPVKKDQPPPDLRYFKQTRK